MPKINKNTDLKPLEEFFLKEGKHTLTFLPPFPFPIPKEGTPIGSFHNYCNWIPVTKASRFNVECNPNIKCPICEMLKKQEEKKLHDRIKERISKLWNHLIH